jgi:hypothetical protein
MIQGSTSFDVSVDSVCFTDLLIECARGCARLSLSCSVCSHVDVLLYAVCVFCRLCVVRCSVVWWRACVGIRQALVSSFHLQDESQGMLPRPHFFSIHQHSFSQRAEGKVFLTACVSVARRSCLCLVSSYPSVSL